MKKLVRHCRLLLASVDWDWQSPVIEAQDRIEAALSLMRPNWAIDQVVVEAFLSGGYRNQNYRLRYLDKRYVIRLAEQPSELDFAREVLVLAALGDLFPQQIGDIRLAIAPVEAALVADGVLLTHWSDLPLLAEADSVNPLQLASYLAALHQVLAGLTLPASREERQLGASASAPNSPSRSHIDKHIADDLGRCGQAPELVAAVLKQLPANQATKTLCHLDLNPWNVLGDGHNWVTLDWETLSYAEPLFDVVALCDGYLRARGRLEEREEFAQQVVRAYNSATGQTLSDAALDAARVRYQWREYAWAAAQLALGNTRAEIVLQRDDYAALLVQQGFDILPGEAFAKSTLPPDNPEHRSV